MSTKRSAVAAGLAKRTRVVNALRAALEIVTLEATDADEDLVHVVEDAHALLRHFDRVISEARSEGRMRLAEQQKNYPERAREHREEEAQLAKILGKDDNGRGRDEHGVPFRVQEPSVIREPSKEELARAEALRTPEPRKVERKRGLWENELAHHRARVAALKTTAAPAVPTTEEE